jgi:integrase/recombinase XerD
MKKYLDQNPLKSMEQPSVYYYDKKFLKKDQIEKIFTAVYLNIIWKGNFIKKRNLAILYVLLCCGLRRAELLGLKSYDVDMYRRLLTVRAETSKSKHERILPLNTKTVYALKEYLEARQKRSCTTAFLFVSSNFDDGLSKAGLIHIIKKIREACGIRFHAHQFRHTFAINLLNNGTDIIKLKQLLGHSDIKMTSAYLRCLPTHSMKTDIELLTFDNLI